VSFEIAISALTTILFMISLVFVNRAFEQFPVGSAIRYYAESYIVILLFIMLYSLWHTVCGALRWRETIGPYMAYPEYVFLALAAGMMLFSSFRIYRLYKKAKELGLTSHE
jgi:chromate transport protein ChrA